MEHFFNLTPNAGAGDMPRKQALETVRNNIEWIRRNENEIKEWLDSNIAWWKTSQADIHTVAVKN